ncbi:hypothetical protein JOM56_012002 [Amanita muscaria]
MISFIKAPNTAQIMASSPTIPVVDFSSFYSSSPYERSHTGTAIFEALRDIGNTCSRSLVGLFWCSDDSISSEDEVEAVKVSDKSKCSEPEYLETWDSFANDTSSGEVFIPSVIEEVNIFEDSAGIIERSLYSHHSSSWDSSWDSEDGGLAMALAIATTWTNIQWRWYKFFTVHYARQRRSRFGSGSPQTEVFGAVLTALEKSIWMEVVEWKAWTDLFVLPTSPSTSNFNFNFPPTQYFGANAEGYKTEAPHSRWCRGPACAEARDDCGLLLRSTASMIDNDEVQKSLVCKCNCATAAARPAGPAATIRMTVRSDLFWKYIACYSILSISVVKIEFEAHTHYLDVAPDYLVVKEAGGVVTDSRVTRKSLDFGLDGENYVSLRLVKEYTSLFSLLCNRSSLKQNRRDCNYPTLAALTCGKRTINNFQLG